MDYECYHHAMEVTSSNHSSRMLRLDYDNSGIRKVESIKADKGQHTLGGFGSDCGTQKYSYLDETWKLQFRIRSHFCVIRLTFESRKDDARNAIFILVTVHTS
ncbi:hypothetical protein CEXT_240631 [Caerostris extrusa]|uniref:Uncharacterized protein n=1 Tax=Caerostris extrusa TaxID=172846 RepID=A0AAV4QIV8_CAEEX|nr:hypothetical protein CEXT_240631 [Caerostris extrusa]